MSYTEYLRRKLAGEPVVVNNQKLRSASEITRQRRLLAASDFPVNGQGIGTMRDDLLLAETSVNPKQPTSFQKNTGRPKDASDFTAYLGAHALQNGNTFVSGTTQNAGKNVQPAACAVNSAAQIAEPSPYITGTTGQVKATTVPRSASDYIRERIACQQQKGQPHTASEVSMEPVFKDDTIRYPAYNKQYLALSSRAVNDSTVKFCDPNTAFPAIVNQVSLAITPRPGPIARPVKAKIPNYDQQFVSQDRTPPVMGTNTIPNCFTGKNVVGKYNTGAVIPSKHPRYVERHHGNDLATMVNGRKPVPGEYQIPAGTPAHLKINDPIGPRVPGM
jgi:hypothetical protein